MPVGFEALTKRIEEKNSQDDFIPHAEQRLKKYNQPNPYENPAREQRKFDDQLNSKDPFAKLNQRVYGRKRDEVNEAQAQRLTRARLEYGIAKRKLGSNTTLPFLGDDPEDVARKEVGEPHSFWSKVSSLIIDDPADVTAPLGALVGGILYGRNPINEYFDRRALDYLNAKEGFLEKKRLKK